MADLRWRVTEIAACPICLEDYKDPRSLPCIHSFCLKCIDGYTKNQKPEDEATCPVCRSSFLIPKDGVKSLPHNFFLQTLIDAREATTPESEQRQCEVCANVGSGSNTTVPAAEVYCVDCRQHLCERCSQPHRVWRGGAHLVKPLNAELNAELIQQRGNYCEKHRDKQLELYCFNCKVNVCLMCFAIEHKQHRCDEIVKVSGTLKKQIGDDIAPVQSRIERFRGVELPLIESEQKVFIEKAKEIESKIVETGEEMKRRIDEEVRKLLSELQMKKMKVVKQVAIRKDKSLLAITALESFQAYCKELESKGRPCDITHAAHEVHKRSSELLTKCTVPRTYHAPDIEFKPLGFMSLYRNVVGLLSFNFGDSDRTVDVVNVPYSVTRDALFSLFESRRKSGGKHVDKLEYNTGDRRAFVTFERGEDARKVISKGVVQLHGWPLHVSSLADDDDSLLVDDAEPELDKDKLDKTSTMPLRSKPSDEESGEPELDKDKLDRTSTMPLRSKPTDEESGEPELDKDKLDKTSTMPLRSKPPPPIPRKPRKPNLAQGTSS